LIGLDRKLDGLSQIRAIRFRYLGKDPNRRLETLPFYLKTIRKFLWKHRGDVVWLKGGIIERPAYLVFKSHLTDEVKEMLSEELREGGMFKIEPVEKPIEVVKKYAFNLRVAVGWLKLPNIELGSIETILREEEKELTQKVKEGFWLTENTFIKADSAQLVIVPGRENRKMVVLRNAVEMLVRNNKIISVDLHDKFGVWKDLCLKLK